MPVEDFLALSGRFSSSSRNRRKREKTRGKRENPLRMKKRLPNLSSAVILPLLSYLAQFPTGRCQSGRMSTPGKCVYRKPVPRVRIPPCPPFYSFHNLAKSLILQGFFHIVIVPHSTRLHEKRVHIRVHFSNMYPIANSN